MKRFYSVILLFLLPLCVFAQFPSALKSSTTRYTMKGHSIDFTLGAGWTELTHSVEHGKSIGNVGAEFHAGYNYFFSRYFGLGVGVDLTRNGGGILLTEQFTWKNVTDPMGNKYDHIADVRGWREFQEAYYVGIPMSVQVAVPFRYVAFSAAWGVKYNFALGDGYWQGKGTINHKGYYAENGYTICETPQLGFYQEDKFRPNGKLDVNHHWAMFLNVGAMFRCTENLWFVSQVYTSSSISPMVYLNESAKVGWRNDRAGMPTTNHAFMSDYTTLLHTPETKGITSSDAGIEGTEGVTSSLKSSSAYSFQLGLQIGFRYIFPTRDNHGL